MWIQSVGQGSGTEEAFTVVDAKTDEFAAGDCAGLLVDLAGGGLVDVDAVHGAGLSAHVTSDALCGLELVDAAITRRKSQVLLRILDRDRLLKTVLQRDPHPNDDGFDVVIDILEIALGVHA
jgi:hypothetical protein